MGGISFRDPFLIPSEKKWAYVGMFMESICSKTLPIPLGLKMMKHNYIVWWNINFKQDSNYWHCINISPSWQMSTAMNS